MTGHDQAAYWKAAYWKAHLEASDPGKRHKYALLYEFWANIQDQRLLHIEESVDVIE